MSSKVRGNHPLRRAVEVLVALATTAALLATAPPSSAETQSYHFTGTVNAAGTRYIPHSMALSGPSTIDATLDWTTASADLNLVLKNANGVVMAQTTGPTTRPETLSYQYTGNAATTWKIMAFARAGTSAYTLDVTVTARNTAPTAEGDTAATKSGNAVAIDVLANDSSSTGGLHIDSFSAATHGSVVATPAATDSLTYTPETNFIGTDSFTYVACDSATPQGCSNSATVTVTVSAPTAWDGTTRVWAAENEAAAHTYSVEQAVGLARKFDAFITIAKSFRNYVTQMHDANPSLILFAYTNGTHTDASDPTVWPEDAYLHDTDAKRVKSARFGSYNMNVWNRQWVNSRPTACRSALDYTHYDNCYVDALATWGYTDTTTTPLNPNTGNPITKQEWLTATTAIAQAVNTGDSTSEPLLGSGGFTGRLYFGTATLPRESQLFDGLDASLHEGFCRNPNAPIGTLSAESAWKQDVEMIRDAEARGKFVLTLTKTWVTGTPAQKSAVMKYCLASFLLGTSGASMFSFTWDKGDAGRYDLLWHTVLGAPAGVNPVYAKIDGVYQRTFANGRILVNPSTSMVTVPLGATYRTPEGQQVTSVTLAPKTAEILTLA